MSDWTELFEALDAVQKKWALMLAEMEERRAALATAEAEIERLRGSQRELVTLAISAGEMWQMERDAFHRGFFRIVEEAAELLGEPEDETIQLADAVLTHFEKHGAEPAGEEIEDDYNLGTLNNEPR